MINKVEIENEVTACVNNLKSKYEGTDYYLEFMLNLSEILEQQNNQIDDELDELYDKDDDEYWCYEDDVDELWEDTDNDFGWEE